MAYFLPVSCRWPNTADARRPNIRRLVVALVFVLDAWAITAILGSPWTRRRKALWIAAVVLAPGLGFAAWWWRVREADTNPGDPHGRRVHTDR